MKKYLVTIEFRYSDAPKNDYDSGHNTKKITIGVFDDFDEAAAEGNKALEVFESKFKLNPHTNRKERFTKNGGCFGNANTLITNLGYLQTPFGFYAKIDTLNYLPVSESIEDVLQSVKRYKEYKAKEDEANN